MKRLLWACWGLLLLVLPVYGQGDYYRSVEGLKKSELKTALHKLIQPDVVLKYGGKGEGYTWSGFVVTDRMPNGSVRDRYSDVVRRFNGLNAVDGMNIEHIFANSWWGHTMNDAYCDLFNLFPSDGSANGRKSNNPVGVVTETPSFDNGVTRVGKSTSYRADSLITVWEPADEWKGDFARSYFYMATCYEDYTDLWTTTEGLLMVERNRYPTLREWVSSLLLEWNEQDPVDDIERERNEAVYGIQGNRNPFVDYPQLSDYIWGDKTEMVFYIDEESTEPELFVPNKGEVIDFGLQALSKGLQGEIEVRGRNLPEGLTLQVNSTDFTLNESSLAAENVEGGTTIVVNCHPSVAGKYTAELTLKGTDFVQTNTMQVEFVNGILVYPARNLICTPYQKRFEASWMSMGDGCKYSLDVYTRDGTSVSGYPKETGETSLLVDKLNASTTYYYKVSLLNQAGQPEMVSNEVEVVVPAVTPVFTANVSEMAFTSIPKRPSGAQTVKITALEVPQYITNVIVDAPFEVSADGENWGQTAVVTGDKDQSVAVRLGCVEQEGHVEGELVLSSAGVEDIIISLSGEVDKQKSFLETFEIGSKGAYAEGNVTCVETEWKMALALMGSDANDQKNGSKAVRMQPKKEVSTLEMLDDKLHGCDSIWFNAGLYGKDSGVKLTVKYSMDGGMTWTPVVNDLTFTKGEWKRYGYEIHTDGMIRLQFTATGSGSNRLNIDDIQMSDYNTGSDIQETLKESPEDIVSVYTLGGIKVWTAKRKDALKGLKPEYYIVK